MEDPDRFEAAHMRHENVDDDQIELFVFEGAQSGFTALGDRHSKIVALETELDGHAHHRVIVDDEDMTQISRPHSSFVFRQFSN